MPQFPEVLNSNPYSSTSDFILEQEAPTESTSALSYAYWQDRITHERWFAKSQLTQPDAKEEQSAFLESCANKVYRYYGIKVPRLKIAKLSCQYHTQDLQMIYLQEYRITTATHLLSRWEDKFHCYGAHNVPFNSFNNEINLKTNNGQWVVERGLGCILAVALFINDIDVIGGEGGNIGYQLKGGDDKLYAISCKIDPGYGFHDLTNPSTTPQITRQIQISNKGKVISFDALPLQTKQEFVATVLDIINTPADNLRKVFIGCSSPEINSLTDNIVINLLTRQSLLAAVFAAELKVQQKVVAQAAIIPKPTFPVPMLEQMYKFSVIFNQNFLYQQAKNFYIPLNVTQEPYDSERPPAHVWTLYSVITAFQAASNQLPKILGLLGDCGTGKSTFTRKITEYLWENYHTLRIVPIRIELQKFSDRTIYNCIKNTLKDNYNLTDGQIAELKQNYHCLIILDGFDEIANSIKPNFWQSNNLNSWRSVKLIITSRIGYIGPEHSQIPNNATGFISNSGVTYYLAPLNEANIRQYLNQAVPSYQSYWDNLLSTQKDLINLLSTPLLLSIFTKVCPTLSNTRIQELTRFKLYEVFMQDWFTANQVKLCSILDQVEAHGAIFEAFSQNLAFEMYNQGKIAINKNDRDIWAKFFDPNNEETEKARIGCPLRKAADEYSFIHKSFYEYFLTKYLFMYQNLLTPGTIGMLLCKEPEANKFLIGLIKTYNPASSQLLTIFLEAVGFGCQDTAEEMLKLKPELGIMKGILTDCADRRFSEITGFQYALWALDYHMWEMIKKYLPKSAITEQLQMLGRVGAHGTITNWQPLINALKTLIDNWDSWSEDQQDNYWCREVGGAQLMLPAHVINEYSRGDRAFDVDRTFKEEGALPRDGIDTWKRPPESMVRAEWTLDEKAASLGNNFAWAGTVLGGEGSAASRGAANPGLRNLSKLFELRSKQLAELKAAHVRPNQVPSLRVG